MPAKVANRSRTATAPVTEVSQDGVDAVNKMNLGNTPTRYILFEVEQSQLVLDETASADKTFEDFVAKFKEIESRNQCRHAIFNVEFDHEGRKIRKLASFLWIPDAAPHSERSSYLDSVDLMKAQFNDIQFAYNCNCRKEADFDISAMKKEIIETS